MSIKPAVSIVMPIYNAAPFLKESLGGLLNQTLKNIEIICVNDGSKDESLEMIRDYAANDPRIKIIDKANSGYGNTMNRGIAIATGEYIGILEPDDFAENDMFEVLYNVAKENDADIVKSNFYKYKTETGESIFYETLEGKEYNKPVSAKENRELIITQPCIWSAIYRKSLIDDNHIVFNETPGASYQDTAFSVQVIVCANKIVFIKDAFIHYRIDNENSSVNSEGKIFSICDEFQAIQSFLNKNAERREMFGVPLQVYKYRTYRWNLKRVAEEFKHVFSDQIALELIKAEYDGFMDETFWDNNEWEKAQKLMNEYKNRREIMENKLNKVYNSTSYRTGKAITAIPRKIKSIIK